MISRRGKPGRIDAAWRDYHQSELESFHQAAQLAHQLLDPGAGIDPKLCPGQGQNRGNPCLKPTVDARKAKQFEITDSRGRLRAATSSLKCVCLLNRRGAPSDRGI